MDVYTLILLSSVAVLLWLFILFASPHQKIEKTRHREPIHGPYAGVAVIPCEKACHVACSTKNKAYLLKDSPHLPLMGCDHHAECTCHFKHVEDRRQHEDRRAMTIVMKDIYHGMERRSSQRFGRRITDFIEVGA